MPRVRLSLGSVLLLGFGCSHETFDLLPPHEEAEQGGTAGGGRGGTSGSGGLAGSGLTTGGPDCPASLSIPCRACRTFDDCERGTLCDTWRGYCAPFCGSGYDCMDPLVCDGFRSVCAECTTDTHCSPLACVRGKCVTPECTSDTQCQSPLEPVCDGGFCRPCESNFECSPSTPVCDRGSGSCRRCEASFECAPNAPVCEDGTCRLCESNSECARNVPVCDRGFCRPPCATSFDCEPGFRCEPGGRCEPDVMP